jgi:hypothetical protein
VVVRWKIGRDRPLIEKNGGLRRFSRAELLDCSVSWPEVGNE